MSATVEQAKTSSAVISRHWKYALISGSFMLFSALIAFWATYTEIVRIWWRSETYAHGFIILPIVAYLIWRQRGELVKLMPKPAPIALIFVFCVTMLWLLGYAADIAVAQHVAVVFLIPILVWVAVGTQIASHIAFPLAYLIFAAPFGDFLVEPLQDITATFSVWALQLTGIPVYLEGRFIQIPTGNFEVAQACSGIRYLIASLALGTLYAYLTYASYWRRLAFILLSFVVPIIANGIRAYGIIMLAHLSDYSLAVGVDHLIYGWLFFGVVIFAMIWLGSFFRDQPDSKAATDPLSESHDEAPALGPQRFTTWAVLAIVLTVSPSVFAGWLEVQQPATTQKTVALPDGLNGWAGPGPVSSQWHPTFVGATESRGLYEKENKQVEVYLAYYSKQAQGTELVSWRNSVFDREISKRLADGLDGLLLNDKTSNENNIKWPVLYTRVESATSQRLIWNWFEIDGKATTSRFAAKLYEIQRRLLAPEKGAAALVLSTTYELTPEEAKQTLSAFLNDMLPELREAANP